MSFNSSGLVQLRVRNALIVGIRQAFAGHPQYPYVETSGGEFDFDNSKIFVSDVTPIESVAYPFIIVDTLAADEQRYLGPDSLGDRFNPSLAGSPDSVNETVTFTSIPLSATIKIYTRDTIVRDELQASVYDTLKINKARLATDGVEIIQTRWLPENREFVDDRWWYVSTITMELYAEYSTRTPITETVSGINLTEIEIQNPGE